MVPIRGACVVCSPPVEAGVRNRVGAGSAATRRRAQGRATRRALALTGVAGAAVLLLWLARPAAPPAPRAVAPGVGETEPRAAPVEAPVAASPPAFAPPPVTADEYEEPAPAPATPWVTEKGEPTRALVRGALAAAIERHDPSLKLSSAELDAATDALWTLREARLELARLGDDPAHARRRRVLVEKIGRATADFSYHVEMSPGELSALDQAGAGLSAPPPVVERAPAPTVTR